MPLPVCVELLFLFFFFFFLFIFLVVYLFPSSSIAAAREAFPLPVVLKRRASISSAIAFPPPQEPVQPWSSAKTGIGSPENSNPHSFKKAGHQLLWQLHNRLSLHRTSHYKPDRLGSVYHASHEAALYGFSQVPSARRAVSGRVSETDSEVSYKPHDRRVMRNLFSDTVRALMNLYICSVIRQIHVIISTTQSSSY